MDFDLEDFCGAKTIVFWDTVECPIPQGLDARTVVENINEALADMRYRSMITTSFKAYCDVMESGKALDGIPMKHLPAAAEPQDKVERRSNILVDLIYEAIGAFNHLNLMLIIGDISGQREFFPALRFLKRRMNINVLLAQHPPNDVSEELRDAVRTIWRWSSLAHGGYPIGVEETDSSSGAEDF